MDPPEVSPRTSAEDSSKAKHAKEKRRRKKEKKRKQEEDLMRMDEPLVKELLEKTKSETLKKCLASWLDKVPMVDRAIAVVEEKENATKNTTIICKAERSNNDTSNSSASEKRNKNNTSDDKENSDEVDNKTHYKKWKREQKALNTGETGTQLRKRYLKSFPERNIGPSRKVQHEAPTGSLEFNARNINSRSMAINDRFLREYCPI